MRSPRPSPPTVPVRASRSPRRCSTYTELSLVEERVGDEVGGVLGGVVGVSGGRVAGGLTGDGGAAVTDSRALGAGASGRRGGSGPGFTGDGPDVVATRRYPPYSDIEYWFSS